MYVFCDGRFLQGWDHRDSTLTRNLPRRLFTKPKPKNKNEGNTKDKGTKDKGNAKDKGDAKAEEKDDGKGEGKSNGEDEEENHNETNPDPDHWNVPHLTILPGLQFTLAGILGKPETFYQVPVIRFIFEIFSYV